ncbi:MAG TPA: cation:proton antiporter, partial [Chitinophagaceae bacterium]|nr:cation:proton antiporter [Chitinophagaceae bacterium]
MANIFNSISHQIVAQIQQPICLLLLQILLILVTSRVFGLLFSKFKQPAVIGEIVAGIFLGLSVFGNLFPHLFNFIFPTNSFNNLEVLSKIGLAFFMFIIGMELDLVALRKRAKSAFIISISSILIPLLLGIVLAYYLYTSFSMPNVRFSIFALFMGISLSITAFPVLARIVKARGMQKTELGTLALSAAAIADVIAWCLLAMMIALAKAGDFSIGLFTILSAIGYILTMFFIVRPFINKMIARLRSAHYGDQSIVLLSFILLLSSAFIAEIIGIHMLFGAFLAGVIIPQNEKLKHALTSKLEDVSELFLLPIFFAF